VNGPIEKHLVLRGALAGAVGGAISFAFARIFAEPVIQASINYENARDAVQATLNKAAGLAPAPDGPDLFSRTIQRDVGAGVGLILFGVAMGALFAVAYAISGRRIRGMKPRVLAVVIAACGFVSAYLVPYLKYPANPPSIGHPDTIHARGFLYLGMVGISVAGLMLAIMAATPLRRRFGAWNGNLLAALGYAVVVGVAMAILPPLGHLHSNVVQFGRHLTETPQPLRSASGQIVFPGFPADTLFEFRLYSIISQMLLWGAVAFVFGALAERLFGPTREPDEPVVTDYPDLGAQRAARHNG
jgi:hypothetical protein